ncbi:MAG: TonB-dependent receptor plug domain-containing protein [Sphingobium sp.]
MTYFRTTSCRAFFAGTIALSSPAFSAEGDIVVTASGFEQPRSETGQAIRVIDRDRIDRLQAGSISDVLETLPGISLRQSGGPGAQTSVFIRGGNSSQTLVLIDGVRINDPSSPNGAFDFGALLTGNIGRVEVLSGPNSVIWGSQAMGGVVNIQTLAPTRDLMLSASGEGGSRDTQRVRANLSGAAGPVEASLGGGWYHTDGISSLMGGQERDGYRNASANGRLKINLSGDVSVDLRGYYNRGRLHYDDPFSLAGPESLPQTRNRQYVGYAGLNADLLDGRWRNRIAYMRTDIDRLGKDPVAFSFNNFRVMGQIDRFEYHGSFDVSQALTLIYGLEHERTRTSTSYEGAIPDIAHSHVTSAFAQMIVRPARGLTLTGGARHDDYDVYGGHTTLGGNIAYTPDDGATVLRATYAEGFRAPTVTEGLPPFGNSALKPESARGFDLGVERSVADDKARLFATWFHRKSRNLIAGFPLGNIDSARASGLELGARLRPAPSLDIEASYALVETRDQSPGTNSGNRLARRPVHSASVTVDWTSPAKLAFGASVRLVGDSFDDAANTVRLDGYALTDVRASYPLTERIEIYGRIENPFDSEYRTVAGYGTLGRSAYAGVRLTL